MKDFVARAPSYLRRLDQGAKLVYTGFLLLTALGLLTAALLHGDGMGMTAEAAAAYWRGDEAQMTYAKSYRQLLELTHFHLFTEPVTFLVLAHLYNLGGDTLRRRAIVSVATLGSIVLQIALPWLVVYASATFSVLVLPVHIVLVGGFAYMTAHATREMWGSS